MNHKNWWLLLTTSLLLVVLFLLFAGWRLLASTSSTTDVTKIPPIAENVPATVTITASATQLIPEPTFTSSPTAEPILTPTTENEGATGNENASDHVSNSNTLDVLSEITIPIRDLYDLAVSFGQIPNTTPRVVSTEPPAYQLGDTLTFTVSNLATSENFDVEATLKAQTEHASWWVDNRTPINQSDLDASARVFEEQTYPTNRAIFGSEWSPGVDGDPRVHIFLGNVPGVGGYYSSADEFPRSVNPTSNEKEIFYLNINNAQPGNDYFDGILAHEFQHMIHWHVDRNEDLWINEGLSELAANLNGFDVVGAAYSFLQDTDIPITRWSDQTHPFYGSAYLFQLYFYQRFGQQAISDLVQHQADGGLGYTEVLTTQGITFDQLFADWAIATLLNDPSIADGQYSYQEITLNPPTFANTIRTYPALDSGNVNQYGIDYIRFEPTEENGSLIITVSGDKTVPLLPTNAHSGNWALWSNRADDSYPFTYRAFDLTALEGATLNFWTWYDIEADYDYAYVAVSTDQGEHWQILPSTSTVESNPNGNSFGPAFTGKSGLSPERLDNPIWQEEQVDLTPFVGQQILLGFHMVTDDALNHNGLLIDDLTIPELNYQEDFESQTNDWQHHGFAQIDNQLPQPFLIQAVATSAQSSTIYPISLDENHTALLTIDNFGTEIEHVTLIITGAMPYTAEQAGYSYAAEISK